MNAPGARGTVWIGLLSAAACAVESSVVTISQAPDSIQLSAAVDSVFVVTVDTVVLDGDTVVVQSVDTIFQPADTVVVNTVDTVFQPADTVVVNTVDTVFQPADTVVVNTVDTVIDVISGDTIVTSTIDTVVQFDTVVTTNTDTVVQFDTVVTTNTDTIVQFDTVVVSRVDTVVRTDTVFQVDTVSQAAPSLDLSQSALTLQVGEVRAIRATLTNAQGLPVSSNFVAWFSSAPDVATVNTSGSITAVAVGDASIYAVVEDEEFNNVASSLSVTVIDTLGVPVRPYLEHEPAGMTVLSDNTFSSLPAPGWSSPFVNTGLLAELDIITDATAPHSGADVARVKYAAGEPPATKSYSPVDYTLKGWSAREIYVSMVFRLSAGWQGHNSSINKVIYLTDSSSGGGGDPLFFMARGTNDSPLYWTVARQNGAFTPNQEYFQYSSATNEVTPAPTDAEVVRGEWHVIEVWIKGNTPGLSDGEVHAWMNGTKILQFTDKAFLSPTSDGTFDNIRWQPIWGGVNDAIESDQFQYMDRIYLSVR